MAREGLTEAQLDRFEDDGYVVVPGVAGRDEVAHALRSINHWLATGFDRASWDRYDQGTFAPDLVADRAIVGLLTDTGGFDLATALVGAPLVPPDTGQIALRFPAAPGAPGRESGCHIDGLPSPANGVPADGRVHGFTLLAAILLSDMPEEGHGNFTVWPGTHQHMARWFAEHGTYVPDANVVYEAAATIAEATARPTAVCGRAGDLVLAHYLLLHSAGRHVGPAIRYAVFFRLSSPDRASLGDRCFTEVWAGWSTFEQRAVAR